MGLPYFAYILNTCCTYKVHNPMCLTVGPALQSTLWKSDDKSKKVTTFCFCLSFSQINILFCEVRAIIYLPRKCFAMIKDNLIMCESFIEYSVPLERLSRFRQNRVSTNLM